MDREEMVSRFAKFLREYVDDDGNEVYINRLKDLLTVTPKRSLAIDWAHLNSFDPELADELLDNPEEAIASAEDAIQIVLREPPLLVEREFKVHARFYNLPKTLLVKELGSEHINKLIQVEGIITRVSEVKPFVEKAVFVCRDCGNEMVRLQRPYENLVKPAKCDACGSRNIELDVDKSRFINFQSFRLQDRPESLKGGQMPRFVDAILLDDLVDTALPGDRVLVTGVLRVILEQKEKRPIFKKILEVNHIEQLSKEIEELEISPEDEQKIRELAKRKDIVDAIVDSIAPAIWGHRIIKKGIALALFGGVQRTLPDGTKLRGESHVLLVGDPGVAKCVDYGTKVVLADGSIRPIGELVNKAIEKAKSEGRLGVVDDGYYAPIDLELYALDASTLKVRKVKANIAWKRTAPDRMFRIKTASGREIRVTPTHPFFVFEDGQFKTRKAEELRVGDRIATPRKENEPVEIPETTDERLKKLIPGSDIFWDRVEEIEEYKPKHPWVYDLQVPEHHNFIANDIFVHNSQLLRYVANLAPRAIYTSGKSSSAAGLTAAAVRDEFTGSWVLEAGVLVLADGGFACLHPDSRVLVDGEYQRIEDLFELQKSYKARSGNEIVDIQEKDMEVVALDLSTMKTRKSRATIIRRKPWKGDLIRLKLRSGNEITLTPDHLLIDGNTLEWKEAERFRIGDKIQAVDENLNPKADEIISIKRVPYEGYVYDLYVPGEHNFIAEGIIVHNCIDEFDKMSDRDRSAIHEALEQQSYHHDFELLLADGRKVKIGELVDGLIEKNRDKVIVGKDTEILPVDDIELLAYDLEKREVVRVKADRVSRHKAPERFIKIRFSNGREIVVTPEHPIIVWEGGKVTEKPAERVVTGDIALGVLRYPIQVEGEFKERYKDPGEAEDYQDYLYSKGIVSKIKRTGMYSIVEKAERTLPKELVKPLTRAGRILGITQTPKERASFNQKLVKESIIEGYLQRVTARLKELESLSQNDPSKAIDVLPKAWLYQRYRVTYGKLKKLVEAGDPVALSIVRGVVEERSSLARRELQKFLEWWSANVNFLKVKRIEEIKNDRWEWVYDVTVEPHHLFVSHGLVLHNTISISKAGITATLNARTTVIAAANPKFGRFNRHKSLPEQLDLPPTLLSRFDLIFLLLDEPDEKVDASIAEHILRVRRGEAEAVTPKIPYDLLKKYIAYARKNVHPVLSREAMEEIKRYYVRMRRGLRRGDEEGVQPIPITARQLEALIRLSEAHARMRLSETVTREDARAAIEIIEAMMKTIAVDEEGNLDVSILEVGKSSKKINKIEKLVDIIRSLESEGEFGAPEERVIEAAKQAGIGTKADIEKLLNELKSDGRVYEPRAGFYRVI